ncbi:MAG: FlgD immunoglobulin-like domain containing protein [candidate division WOR-3 bacterium]
MFDEYGEMGFVPLSINLWENMETVVKPYARQYTYPFFRDGGSMWSLYNISNSIPLNYVIDTAGIVVGGMVGFNEYTIRSWIEPYLGVAENNKEPLPKFTTVSPNPANRTQQIRFTLPNAGNVTLRVYSVSGELIRTVFHGSLNPGAQVISWNLTDDQGRFVPNGLYFYELSLGQYNVRMKTSVLR